MAEGWLNYYGKGHCTVSSAGLWPEPLDLEAANAMSEAIIDTSRYQPKSIESFTSEEFDYVICLSDDIAKQLPTFNGSPEMFFFGFPDVSKLNLPEKEHKKAYADLRDEIENFCFDFVHQKVRPLI